MMSKFYNLAHLTHPTVASPAASVCRDSDIRQGRVFVIGHNQGLHVNCAPDASHRGMGGEASGASPQNTRGEWWGSSCCVAYPQRRPAQWDLVNGRSNPANSEQLFTRSPAATSRQRGWPRSSAARSAALATSSTASAASPLTRSR